MKTLLLSLFAGLVLVLCMAGYNSQITEMKTTGELPSGAKIDRKLPDGVYWLLQPEKHIFAGPQLAGDELERFVTQYPIKVVIRLNMEAKALARLDTTAQRRLLSRHGVKLYCFNIEGKNGQLNETNLRAIDDLLLDGNAYVHCLNGVHRAKAVAGRYYARKGYKKHTIFDLLDWWPVVRDRRYEKYVSHVADQTKTISK